MAGINPWLAASIAMLLALPLPVWTAFSAPAAHRLVAIELAAVITTLLLVGLSIAFGQPSFLDLAIALVVLSLPGTLVFAVFLERWL